MKLHPKRLCQKPYLPILGHIKAVINTCKEKWSKDSLAAMNVLVASVSGENVSKSRCIKRLSDELNLPVGRVSVGKRIRTKVLRSDRSCWVVTKRKTRLDAMSMEHKHLCYEFWKSSVVSRPTGYKKDIKKRKAWSQDLCVPYDSRVR